MNYYQFHIGDYRGATAHLSNEEDLAYRRLLDMYYDSEKPIPKETQWVSRRLRVGSEVVIRVLQDFFQEEENGWVHRRCEMEIAGYRDIVARNRNNGKLGGRPRKTQSVSSGNPVVTLTSNQEPVTKNQEPNEKEKSNAVPLNAKPACPYSEIIKHYHEILPEMPAVKVLTNARKAYIKARWNEHGQSIEWWVQYFTEIKKSDFLCGRSQAQSGRKPFIADLEWLVRPSNMAKVIEGKYTNNHNQLREYQPRLTGTQAYMVELGNMLEQLEERKNGANLAAGTGITDAACFPLPGDQTYRGDT